MHIYNLNINEGKANELYKLDMTQTSEDDIFTQAKKNGQSTVPENENPNDLSILPWSWDPEIGNIYGSQLTEFLDCWTQKKNQQLQSSKLNSRQIKKMSKEFEREKKELVKGINDMLQVLRCSQETQRKNMNDLAKKHGVYIFHDKNGDHYVIDSGFTNQFAMSSDDPMRYYDESTLSDEDKEILNQFKAISTRNDAVNANIDALNELLEKINNTNFESLKFTEK